MYGVDLAEWVAARRWSGLLDLIYQLPDASRYKEAIYDDPERAAEIASWPESTEKWTPRLKDWNLTAILLRENREAILAVRAAIYNTTFDDRGKPFKAPKVPVFPTPVTEVDRQKAALSERFQMDLIADLAPHALQAMQLT